MAWLTLSVARDRCQERGPVPVLSAQFLLRPCIARPKTKTRRDVDPLVPTFGLWSPVLSFLVRIEAGQACLIFYRLFEPPAGPCPPLYVKTGKTGMTVHGFASDPFVGPKRAL